MIKEVTIKNFKSIKNATVPFTNKLSVLAGQNESGKSSILEALEVFESENFRKDTLNFEEEQDDNFIQSISVKYTITDNDAFFKNIIEDLEKEFKTKLSKDDVVFDKLSKIKEFTITKEYDFDVEELKQTIEDRVFSIIKASIKEKIEIKKLEDDVVVKETESIIDLEDKNKEVSIIFFENSPEIVMFNDFSALLPDKIEISDLESENEEVDGYKAVKNLEKLMSKDFVKISKASRTSQKNSITAKEVDGLSVTFQKDWKQKIYGNNDVKISFSIENDDVGGKAVPTVFFDIQTKDGVQLEPRKRSKGMIWFLSAWLDLKAREKGEKLVILYDEPGLYLHVKAHKDILGVFETLSENGHQIIYSTHSPSLINTDRLDNIGLVLNTEKEGTLVEGLTTSKINTENKKDALQPIAEAMGLEPLKDFSILSQKNVLLEGLSDFWYFQGMALLLGKKFDFKFIPGIGIKESKIFHLISFCIGYGLDWLLVMDNGEVPIKTKENLSGSLFNDSEESTNSKVKLIPFKEVEEMFSIPDLALIDEKIKHDDKRAHMTIIGKKRKIIFSKTFFQKVKDGEINKSNISDDAKTNFEDIFSWIKSSFK